MKFCPACGRKIEEDAYFCSACGRSVATAPQDAILVPGSTKTKGPIRRAFSRKHKTVKQLRRVMKHHRSTVGMTVTFGSYPKSADGKDAPIEWQVIAEDGDCVLLLSRYGIDRHRFHEHKMAVSWEYSDVRRYLNGRFADTAFSPLERRHIASGFVRTDAYRRLYRGEDGHVTRDRVFLLSREEAERYLVGDGARVCMPTEYAVRRGVLYSPDRGSCRWWLRTPGKTANSVCCVGYQGSIFGVGNYVNFDILALRPAMWIQL